jgi:hypothetical protein
MGRTIVESVDLSHQVLRSTARVRPLRPWASLESMSALFDPAASARELLPLWLAFFALTTALFVALGFAWERSPRGRARHPRSSGERGNSWATHPFTYHALHHARWTGHFGLGTTVLDRLLGTEWSDWPELHRRVLDGDPMRSFKDQGEHPARAIADGAHRAAPRPPGRAQ